MKQPLMKGDIMKTNPHKLQIKIWMQEKTTDGDKLRKIVGEVIIADVCRDVVCDNLNALAVKCKKVKAIPYKIMSLAFTPALAGN